MTSPEGSGDRCVIVGSGIGGMVTALCLAPYPVTLVTGGRLGAETSSAWAQGGIAASVGDDDDHQRHAGDTVAAGHGLCDRVAVVHLLSKAKHAIALLESHGIRFDRNRRGGYALGLEAAHSRHRILHIDGDRTGAAITGALADAVLRTPSVSVRENTQARRLITDDEGVAGLLCARDEKPHILSARRVVLATGGIGGLFGATTNPASNFGQGIAMAARAGAEVTDMEFVQFHPTALDVGHIPLPLISEAVRGEGARLLDEFGGSVMGEVDGGDLAPRDVVARSIFRVLSSGGRVYLDARTEPGGRFKSRFPYISALCVNAGIDPARQLIPVRPAAHYHMGGLKTDLDARTTLPGLWAVGEVACTGLHGANRLASNSLLEATLTASIAARDIKIGFRPPLRSPEEIHLPPAPDISHARDIAARHLGIARNGTGLLEAIDALLPMASGGGAESDPAIVALLVAGFALMRQESRGAHAREDFPLTAVTPVRRSATLTQTVDLVRDRRRTARIA